MPRRTFAAKAATCLVFAFLFFLITTQPRGKVPFDDSAFASYAVTYGWRSACEVFDVDLSNSLLARNLCGLQDLSVPH